MKPTRLTGFVSGLVSLAVFAPSAFAATTLQELLEEVKNARGGEQKLTAEREKEFLARRDKQASMLKDAQGKLAAAEAKSKALSAQYDANDKNIISLNELLGQREGNLGELFGVTRQVAGDVSAALFESMIGIHYPDRGEPLVKMAGSKSLPSIGELERMWFEMTREMTETGTVVAFKAKIAAADGTGREAEVVRVGPFIVMSQGEFPPLPTGDSAARGATASAPGDFTKAARDLQAATSGYVEAGVDPSRGVLLALSVERPTIIERIQKGQFVGYVIITVGVIGALLALFQFFYLLRTRSRVRRQLANLNHPTADNPVGRVLLAFKGDADRIEEQAEVAELRISEATLREVPPIERFQSFLRLAVAAGPLLGLIGTVIGMIITFQSITESGSSDPKLMAAGIGQAMIATVLGLGIAIPLLFANAALNSMSRQIVQVLDEQSTGLLAETIEKRQAEAQAPYLAEKPQKA